MNSNILVSKANIHFSKLQIKNKKCVNENDNAPNLNAHEAYSMSPFLMVLVS